MKNVEKLNQLNSENLIFWKTQAYILAGILDELEQEIHEHLKKMENVVLGLDSVASKVTSTADELEEIVNKQD